MFNRFAIAVGFAVLFCGATVSAAEDGKKPALLRFATIAPVHSSWGERFRDAKAEISRRTEGRVKLVVYAGGVMGDEVDVVRKINLGQLDGAGFVSQGIAKMIPAMQVFNLPYLYRSPDEFSHVQEAFRVEAGKILKENGLVLLGWGELGGFVQFYSANPIQSEEDFRKAKIWGWTEEPISIEAMRGMGLEPVVLPFTQVFTALQTGLIDSAYGTSLSILVLNWYRYLKHAVRMNVAYPQAIFFVTQKAMDRLSTADQQAVKDVLSSGRDEVVRLLRRDDKSAEDGLIKHGVEYIDPPAELIDRARTEVQAVWKKLSGSLYPEELLARVLKQLDTYRKTAKKTS